MWSDGREIGAADFAAQWRALSGKDSAYWTARNAGYDRIEKIAARRERPGGQGHLQPALRRLAVAVLAAVPEGGHGHPGRLQRRGARASSRSPPGPFALQEGRPQGRTATSSSPATRAGGAHPAKLDRDRAARRTARQAGRGARRRARSDVAEVDPAEAEAHRLSPSRGKPSPLHGPGAAHPARRAWARPRRRRGAETNGARRRARRGRRVRRAAAVAQRVRGAQVPGTRLHPARPQRRRRPPRRRARPPGRRPRAGPRGDRRRPCSSRSGLPAVPVGSHLALSGQAAYADNSGALGGQDTDEAEALLADAGLGARRPAREAREEGRRREGRRRRRARRPAAGPPRRRPPREGLSEGQRTSDGTHRRQGRWRPATDETYVVGDDDKPYGEPVREDHQDPRRCTGSSATPNLDAGRQAVRRRARRSGAARPGAYAPEGRPPLPPAAASGRSPRTASRSTLRFVLPVGAGLRARCGPSASGSRAMLDRVGIRTADHQGLRRQLLQGPHRLRPVRPGAVLLARVRLPRHRRPARSTPSRCPPPTARCNVEQNYTRVGTDQVDQLFDQAVADPGRGQVGRAWSARPTPGSGRPPGPFPSTSGPSSRPCARTSPTWVPSASRHPSTRTWAS